MNSSLKVWEKDIFQRFISVVSLTGLRYAEVSV